MAGGAVSVHQSGEPPPPAVSLKEHLVALLESGDKVVLTEVNGLRDLFNQYVALVKEAIDKAEEAQKLRNQVSNEFRASLDDQAKLQVSTSLFDSTIKDIRQAIATLATTFGEKIDADRTRLGTLESTNASTLSRLGSAETAATGAGKSADELATKVGSLEQALANLQGRVYMVGAGATFFFVVVEFAIKYLSPHG